MSIKTSQRGTPTENSCSCLFRLGMFRILRMQYGYWQLNISRYVVRKSSSEWNCMFDIGRSVLPLQGNVSNTGCVSKVLAPRLHAKHHQECGLDGYSDFLSRLIGIRAV